MGKMMKKLLCTLLVLLLCITSVPLTNVEAAEENMIPDDAKYFNGHWYKVYDISKSWTNAKAYCENLGGHLVTITSREENDFIKKLIIESPAPSSSNIFWIGASDSDVEGAWKWVTNEPFSYTNWGTNEPDNIDGADFCTIYRTKVQGTNRDGSKFTVDIGQWDDYAIYKNDTVYFICEWENDNLSQEIQLYIQQHIDFINSNTYNNLMTNATFYETLWQYESTDRNFTAYTIWEVLGDIGEVATLNFNDLFVTENPYDVILTDILSGYVVNDSILNNCCKELENVFNVDKIANDFVKMMATSDEWNDATDADKVTEALKAFFGKSNEKFIDGVFFSAKEYNFKEKHPGAYDKLSSIFSKTSVDKWNGLFGKIENFSTFLGYINTTSDVVECYLDAYQKYLIAQALVTSQQDVLGSLMVAGYYMPPIASELLSEAINDYLEVLDYDSAFGAVCNYMFGGSVGNVYNIFRGSLEKLVYSGIAKMLGVAAGNVSAVVLAYNFTYLLLDYFSGLGDASKLFFLLDSAAMLEEAVANVVSINADKLRGSSLLSDARLFDASWGLLQAIEQYSYSGLSRYLSAVKRSHSFDFAIKTTVGGYFTKYFALRELNEKNSKADTAIQVAVMFEGEWKNSSCHIENSDVSKVVSVKCPTDVYVYDKNKEPVLTIINNKIEVCDIHIAAFVDGDEKIFALPDGYNYEIEIVGTDEGTMDYSVCDFLDNQPIEYTEYEDIKLSKDCVYTGTLSEENNDDVDYTLSLDSWICTHTSSSWITDTIPTCTAEGSKHTECINCGETTSTETIPALGHTSSSWITDLAPTCTAEGSKHIECTVCEEVLKTEPIAKLPHTYNSVVTEATCEKGGFTTYTCSCGDTYTDDKTPAKGHNYVEGVCENCGESKVDNCTHLCHKSGFLGFIWKIVRFIIRLFRVTPVCSCGMSHY